MNTLKRLNLLAIAGIFALSVMISAVIVPQTASAFSGGYGDEDDPYQITNCTQLQSMNDSSGYRDENFILTNDINCNGVDFTRIDFGSSRSFRGVFDGAGHKVSNIAVNNSFSRSNGIFYQLQGATVKDLTIQNASVTGEESIGLLAGSTTDETLIENVTVTNGSVVGIESEIAGYIGGLVGEFIDSEMFNVVVDITVNAPDGSMVGGLVGSGNESSFGQVASLGTVQGGDLVGGLAGYAQDSSFDKAFATGNVTGNAAGVGGLVGFSITSEFIGTYARGSVTGPDDVGGHIGLASGDTIVGWAYATGKITMTSDGPNGGLIGRIDNSDDDGEVEIQANTFWDLQTSEKDTSAGNGEVGKTTAEMKDMETYIPFGWNFEDYWFQGDDVNDGYLCQIWYQVCYDAFMGNTGGSSDPSNKIAFANTVANKKTVVELGENCSNLTASASAESTVTKDIGYDYAAGLVSFAAECSDGSTEVKVYQYGMSAKDLVLRKYIPATGVYFTVQGATIVSQTIDGEQVAIATYTIVDNGPLDLDSRIGYINDPIGLANLSLGAPNTGLGGRN